MRNRQKLTMPNWTNSPSLELICSRVQGSTSKRRFLIFVVPRRGAPSPLLRVLNVERNFDIAARFYEEPGVNERLADGAEYVMSGGLSKFHAAALFLDENALHTAYDGYFFLDGDLEFDPAQLNHFLSFVSAAGMDLAQPALTRDSYSYWNMAYHQPGYIFRKTSFVEVMAPYLSRAALSKTRGTFTRSISTYGLDLVWPALIGGSAICVVDAFQIRHRERVDHRSGGFYNYLKSIGVDLDEEERRLLADYGVAAERAHSRTGYFWKQPWPLSHRPPRLVSVPLGGPEKRLRKQFLLDSAMHLARLRPGREEHSEGQLEIAIGPHLSGSRISSSPVE